MPGRRYREDHKSVCLLKKSVTIGTSNATPGSTIFSRSSAQDVVVSVDGEVTGLKNNISNVNPDNYVVGSGSVTIKKEYLAGLSDGEKKFRVLMADGSDIEYFVTVGD